MNVAGTTERASAAARRLDPRRLVRYGAPLVWAGAFAENSIRHGLPVGRDRLLLWIFLGLLAFSITNPRRFVRGVALEWLPFALILLAYDLLRGYADGLLLPAHVRPQIDADKVLGVGSVPSVWLQRHLWDGPQSLHWYDYATWGVYVTHFFGTLTLAFTLWVLRSSLFRRYVATVSLLAAAGFTTYVLFPAVPPWMASEHGDLPPTARLVKLIWRHVPIAHFRLLFEKGSRYANDVAAIPSLHAAYALLITLVLWRVVRWWPLRLLLAAYPVAMAFALVYSGEHYAIDILIGWAYAVAAYVAVERLADWLAARRA
ncbi:MAG TPA: phosphatase PAP2 family protein, partial [Gaiellaceae bacterium]